MQIPVNINRDNFNPWLWVNADTLGTDNVSYFIAGNANQLSEGNWFRVNQYCSILSIYWLKAPRQPGDTYGFPDLSTTDQQSSAQVLIGFDSMAAQAQYAVQQLSGQQITLSQLNSQLRTYSPGTQIWFGNDVHVQGAYVGQERALLVYDPNTGETRELEESAFLTMLGNLGVNTIVVHIA